VLDYEHMTLSVPTHLTAEEKTDEGWHLGRPALDAAYRISKFHGALCIELHCEVGSGLRTQGWTYQELK
jgi:hypothetical protein